MLTDNYVKGVFIQKAVTKDLLRIRQAQIEIARDSTYHHGRKGWQTSSRKDKMDTSIADRLIKALSRNAYQVSGSDTQLTFTSQVPLYIRFLDMKHLGNWRIYNAQIWGILYNNALPEIRYGFTQEVCQNLINSLSSKRFNIKSRL